MDMIDNALQLFTTNGIRPVSMHDIEKATGEKWDSKINKAQLVALCVQRLQQQMAESVATIPYDEARPTEWILAVYKNLLDHLLIVNLAFFNDLKKHHQETYEHLIAFGDKLIFDEVKKVLQKGKEQGLFSKEVEPGLECTIHKMMLERVVWDLRFETQRYTTDQMFTHLFKVRFMGIITSNTIAGN